MQTLLFPVFGFISGGTGGFEWLVLLIVLLLVYGPRRLPDIARRLGRWIEQARRGAEEFRDALIRLPSGEGDADSGETESAAGKDDAGGETNTGTEKEQGKRDDRNG